MTTPQTPMSKNKELGLPFGRMEKVAICFDVDGTLIDGDKTYNATLDVLRAMAFQSWKNLDVIVWSGGGADYARTQYNRITKGCDERYVRFYSKLEHKALREKYAKLIIIDDIQDTAIGDVNLIVRNK